MDLDISLYIQSWMDSDYVLWKVQLLSGLPVHLKTPNPICDLDNPRDSDQFHLQVVAGCGKVPCFAAMLH